MLRILDIILAAVGLLVLAPVFLILLAIGFFDTGSPLFCQVRLGRNQQPFVLFKFRTMKPNTASVPSHMVDAAAITSCGRFLRHTKLDELPQLWNVLKGEMSLVGPRPGLSGQVELTQARTALRVFAVRPGITGLAQITGVDMSEPGRLAETDRRMIDALGVRDYFRYLFATVSGRGRGDRVREPT